MKRLIFLAAFFLLALSVSTIAQGRPGKGSSGSKTIGNTTGPNSSAPTLGNTPSLSRATAFLSGKVAIDDGTQLTEPAAIQTICRGQRHTVAYTDRHGNFSFQFGDASSVAAGDLSDASSSMPVRSDTTQNTRNWQDCELQAVLAGFSSELVELASRMSTLESVDIGRLILHRMQQVEGTSISVTSALAPSGAKKAFEKGREEAKKGKLDQAQQSFEKAVQIYPKYAIAWNELGRAQMQKNDLASAKNSFQQAVAADSKYVNPYDALAQLAFQKGQWREVVDITNKLLALNPVNFPSAYFLNGVANFYLHDLDAGEKIARQGIRVDDGHQVPKLDYLLGMILLQNREYKEASEHMQQYLHLATQPADVAEANKQLAEIARLSATPSSAAASEKK